MFIVELDDERREIARWEIGGPIERDAQREETQRSWNFVTMYSAS